MARRQQVSSAVMLIIAAVLVSGMPSAPAASPADASAAPGRIDPQLLGDVAAGPAMAIMSWDRSAATPAEVSRHLEESGLKATVLDRVPVAYACAGSRADLASMAQAPGARAVVANRALTPTLNRSVPTAFNGNPNAIWQGMGMTGKDVTIAVLDTGVDGTHPDIQMGARVRHNVRVVLSHADVLGPTGQFCQPDSFTDEYVGQMENTDLTSGHGTHLTSVAAGDGTASDGTYKGVAPEADIIGVGVVDTLTARVEDSPGCASRGHMSYDEAYSCGTQVSTLGAIAGINLILSRFLEVANPAKVILAGWSVDGLYDPWHPLAQAVQSVWYYGISFVTAAGNGGPATSDCSVVSSCHFNPIGVGETPIAVAAGGQFGRQSLESYSSRGDPSAHTYHLETFRYEPTLTAPGTGVVAARATVAVTPLIDSPAGNWLGGGPTQRIGTDPEHVGMTGTSVAAAHVAGAVALMQQAALQAKGCYLSAGQVKDVLRVTATPMDGYAPWEVGAGMIDITRAVDYARFWPKESSRETYMCPPG